MRKTTITIILTMFALMGQLANAKSDRIVNIKIVETSDVHGYFFPTDLFDNKPLQGTMSRINNYVERQRKTYGKNLLLMDNGDILQGQPTCYWSNYVMPLEKEGDKTNIAASIINYMKYDVQNVGNHDIETGHEVYDKWIREVKCPVLAANMIDKNTGKPYTAPYVTFVRDGVKITVLGMITSTMSCWLEEELYKGMDFEEMVSNAKHWVKVIKEREKPDLIVGLFHSGKNGGIQLSNGMMEDATELVAKEVPGFDIIFFGHDHQVHNDWVTNIEGKKVLCLDPSCFAQNVAEANIQFTFQGKKLVDKKIEGNIVNMRNEAVDEQMLKYYQPQIDRIKKYVGKKIGTFAASISTRESFFGNSAFTDFIQNMQLELAHADISFTAPLSFNAVIKQGEVTVADMFKLYRFENKLCMLRMTGKEIRQHLEMSYDLWANTMTSPQDHVMQLNEEAGNDQQRMGFRNFTFNFDAAAGIDYVVDVTKSNGQKVHILQMSNGEPFMEDKWYNVAMNSYRANGGGELLIKGAGIPKDSINDRIIYQSKMDFRHYIMEEISKQGVVHPKANSNWKFIPEAWTKPAIKRDYELLFGNKE